MKNTILNNTTHTQTHTCSMYINWTLHFSRPAHAVKNRLARVAVIAGMLIVLAAVRGGLPPEAHALTNNPSYGVTAAVLPFEVFSIDKEPTLGADVAALIAKQLALNPSISCVESQKIQAVLQPDDYVSMTEDRLRQLAKHLNANCIIMGTITKIRTEHSIDVEMFTTASAGPAFKTFAEGLEIQSLVETIVTTLDQEIIEEADKIPTAERTQVSTGRQSSPNTPPGGYNVERELLEAFGPPQVEPSADETQAADTVKDAEPVVTEKQKETTPAPSPASLAAPEITVAEAAPSGAPAEKPEKTRKEKKRSSLKDTTDPGFFSLSKAISINADTMEYDNRSNMAVFNGNVVARQDDIAMFANSMQVFYSEDGGLSRVEATGDVRVVQGDRIATGNSIVFDNASQTIVATGNPRVWQGDNVVHGRKITVYLREERTVVESEPNSRASATIYPDTDKKRP